MTRSRGTLALVAMSGLCLCAVGYNLLRATDRGPAPPARAAGVSQSSGGTAAETAELSALRLQVARLEAQVRGQGAKLAATEVVPTDPAAAAPAELAMTPEAIAEREHKRREYMAEIATSFRNEAIDPRWSSATASAVQTALAADHELRQRVRSVECRSQTCRIELEEDRSPKGSMAIQLLALQVGRELPAMLADRVDGDGGPSTVLYMGQIPGMQVTVQ